MAKRGKSTPSKLPSEAELLEFVQASGGNAGKREIARAFDIKGGDRIALKAMLKGLADSGKLARRHRRLIDTSTLPPITAIEVVGIDPDGELIGVPLEWDETVLGKPPRILIESASGSSREDMQPPARGERILAKIEPTSDPAWPFKARIVRRLSDSSRRVLGIFRVTKGQGARIIPVDKKARHDLRVQPGDENDARNGELVSAEVRRDVGRGPVSARVRERLGDMEDQRNISLIAIHQHGIPDSFPERVLAEAAALKPFSQAGRTDLRNVPLDHHRSAGCTGP